jgi:hypothetical protein
MRESGNLGKFKEMVDFEELLRWQSTPSIFAKAKKWRG